MALGLTRSKLESDIGYELRRLGGGSLDGQAVRKIAEAVADAIHKNNRQIEQQLRALGLSV